MSNKISKLEELETEIIGKLYDLAQNPNVTNFERDKIIIAKNLIEQGSQYYTVLRRLQITFLSISLKNELSEDFYKDLPHYIEQEGKTQAGFSVGAFLAPSIPL